MKNVLADGRWTQRGGWSVGATRPVQQPERQHGRLQCPQGRRGEARPHHCNIVAVLSNHAENHGKQHVTGHVRRRLASVIPAATVATPPVREPAWISGELRSARGGMRGGQRGGFRGGQWGGRGQSPLERSSPLPLLEWRASEKTGYRSGENKHN